MQNFTLCYCSYCCSGIYYAHHHLQLLHVLHNRFGAECFWTAHSNLVRAFLVFSKFIEDRLKTFFPNRFPFDWRNIFGYTFAILIQFKMAAMPLRFIDCFGSFGLTAFLFSTTVAEDWKNDIQSINENVQNKLSREHIHEQLIDLIRFTNIKRFEFPF